ncbi:MULTISPECIES: hypothetical protein [Actinomadura]|uniref:Uncharacterized protein n=1 Tax=Actinomadura yumaensis TaxID=111807 RepID=A0ABW2CWU4_9ACTN|nr:hypothetical protein [Actinomadura sp. J1-007]
MTAMTAAVLAGGDSDILGELLMDRLIKFGIVVVALVVLVVALAIVYRKVGNGDRGR